MFDDGTQRWPKAFAHLTIKYPKPEHIEDVLASMQRVADAAQGARGLIRIGPWRDTRSGRVVGLAIWESKAAFEAAMPEVFRSYDDPDPEGTWEERPTDIMHITAVM
jgi:quinol monooxygenase YgiN